MRRLAVVLPLALLPLVACGGDDGPSLEERRAAYLERAEAVCAQANEELSAMPPPTAVATVADYADDVVALLRRTVDELAALEPPQEDREEIEQQVIEPLRADVPRAEEYAAKVRAAAQAGDGAALLSLLQQRPQTSADLDFMRDYGFVECVEAADTTG